MDGNIRFNLIHDWAGIPDDTADGDVVEVSHIAYLTDNGIIQYATTGALNAFDCDEIFVIIAIFVHHESGCAWIYAKHASSGQHVRIDIRHLEESNMYGYGGFVEFDSIDLDDLPF